ncbi:MAG: dTDP-4-dehydrorhamnose 3,5-epimerase [Halioglobus sp.]|nr:dTDP-4-dehydrorhamnose 3,5-epimerase [Halioglobus sp.]
MNIVETPLQDLLVIEPKVFGDERGFFLESWNAARFADAGLDLHFVQDNHSRSARGILRGLHYQLEHTQGKLVRVTSGEVFDAVVDLRESSPSFGRSFGLLLTENNHRMLWIPPGFAHGFYVTSDYADFQYKCTDIYHPQSEVSLAWDDPVVGIEWPLSAGEKPLLSTKDSAGLSWAEAPKFP